MKSAGLLIVASLSVATSGFAGVSNTADLMLAAGHGDTSAVKRLLDEGTNVNVTDDGGYTALNYAVWESKLATVHLLLVNGADANAQPPESFTPLVVALGKDDFGIVAELLEHGADVNLRSGLLGVTPLMAASGGGNLDVVKELLARGAKINDKDNDGETALEFATHEKKWVVVKYLREHGATK